MVSGKCNCPDRLFWHVCIISTLNKWHVIFLPSCYLVLYRVSKLRKVLWTHSPNIEMWPALFVRIILKNKFHTNFLLSAREPLWNGSSHFNPCAAVDCEEWWTPLPTTDLFRWYRNDLSFTKEIDCQKPAYQSYILRSNIEQRSHTVRF